MSQLKNLNLQPMGNLLLVVPIEAKHQGRILIPDTAKEPPQLYFIAKVGTGKPERDANGKLHAHVFQVKEGDKIIASKYGGTEIQVDGVTYKLLRDDDVLAVVT